MTTHLTWADARRVAGAFVIPLAVLVVRPPALAAGGEVREPVVVPGPAEAAQEQEQALEREEAQKLRRMREELETRRREAARRLEAERARQAEISRLCTTVMTLQQRESTLHHEVRSLQQQLGTFSRDPADHSAVMRRYELERELGHSQNQLDYATRLREGAARQFDTLRFRY